MLDRTEDLAALVENWLAPFERALGERDQSALKALFLSDGYWRDVLALTWGITTVAGADAIAGALTAGDARPTAFRIGRTAPRRAT